MSIDSPTKTENEKATQADWFAIRLFACLLIYGGISSALGMILHLIDGNAGCDLGFLLFFVGKGLLQRSGASLAVAYFIAWLGIIFSPIWIILSLTFGEETPIRLWDIDTGVTVSPYLLVVLPICCLAFFLWQVRVMSKERVSNEFSAEKKLRNSWWLVIALLSLALCSVEYSTEYMAKRLIGAIEQCEATIIAVDASTYERLNPSYGFDRSSVPCNPEPLLPRISDNFCSLEDGTRAIEVSWLSNRPITVEVSSQGYERKEVVLSAKDEGETIRVMLRKEKLAGKKTEHGEP